MTTNNKTNTERTVDEVVKEFHDKFPSRNPDIKPTITKWLRTTILAERQRAEGDLKKYSELLLAVESKFDGETRHETALRYIKQAEEKSAIANRNNIQV